MKLKLKTADLRFVAALIIVHAVFLAIALNYRKIFNGDSAEYIYMALNIKERFWFYCGNPVLPVVPEFLTLRPPGYSLFLLLTYLFTVNNWVVLIVQNCLSIFNICYLRHTILALGYKKKYDWILLAFVLLYPSQFVNVNTITPDILLQTSVVLYFGAFVSWFRTDKWRYAFAMSGALVFGLLVKPVLYPFAYVHCLLVLSFAFKGKNMLRPFLVAILPVLVVLMYGYWNYQRTGKLHFTSTQSFNAVFYQNKYIEYAYGRDSAAVFLAKERQQMAAIPAFKDRYDYANQRSVALLRHNFFDYAWFHIKYSLWILVAPGKGELDIFLGELSLSELYQKKQPPGLLFLVKTKGFPGLQEYVYRNPSFPLAMLVLVFNCIKLLGLALFFLDRKIGRYTRIFVLVIIGYFIFTAGPIANSRYFVPVALITAGCAAIGYQRLLIKYRDESMAAEMGNE